MLTLIVCALALAIVARFGPTACGRVPESVRAEASRTIRGLRLRAGGYSLKLLMSRMVDDMLASVLPSVTRSYVPSNMHFGLHPSDARRWGGYFPELATELRALMLAEVAARQDLYVQGMLRYGRLHWPQRGRLKWPHLRVVVGSWIVPDRPVSAEASP